MRILVIGASGFVGRALVANATRLGHTVMAASRSLSISGVAPKRQVPLRRLLEEPRLADGGAGLDAVIHAAGVINGTDRQLREGNTELTRQVAVMMRSWPQARLVYISSVSAIDELGAYGSAKRESERCLESCGVESFITLRPSLLYGPGDSKNVAMLYRLINSSPVIPVPGGNGMRLQPLHIDDLADATLRAASGQGENRHAYTVAGPEQIGLMDMMRTMARHMGKRPLLIPFPLAALQKTVIILDKLFPFLRMPVQQIAHVHDHAPWSSEQAVRDLSLRARTFETGARDMIRHLSKQDET